MAGTAKSYAIKPMRLTVPRNYRGQLKRPGATRVPGLQPPVKAVEDTPTALRQWAASAPMNMQAASIDEVCTVNQSDVTAHWPVDISNCIGLGATSAVITINSIRMLYPKRVVTVGAGRSSVATQATLPVGAFP